MENDESIENLGAEAGTGDSENALTLGDRYADRGEWTLAEEQYRRAVELGNLHALYRLGRALHEQRRLEEAEAVYREAIAEGDMGAAIALGNLFNERGNPDNFETAAKVSRSSPFVHDAFYVYRAEDERGPAPLWKTVSTIVEIVSNSAPSPPCAGSPAGAHHHFDSQSSFPTAPFSTSTLAPVLGCRRFSTYPLPLRRIQREKEKRAWKKRIRRDCG